MLNERVERNRKILAAVMETVVLSGKQNISLRGHRDDSQYYGSKNPGNFQALPDFRISAGDNILKKHFEVVPKNATYRSKTIQNKLITICGHQIEQIIKKEVEQCRFFSILADEASDCSKKEQMALILRYVAPDNEITELFIRFIHCNADLSGDSLSKKILNAIKSIGLQIDDCRRQGYDGASAMSSITKGVAGNILKVNPKAKYMHCASHRLNLCIAKCCKISVVSNSLDNARSLVAFLSQSTKRSALLSEKLFEYGLRKSKLADPSLTRWIARISSLDGIIDGHEVIVETLEEMKFNIHRQWNPPTPGDAVALLPLCSSFDFIATLPITTDVLDYSMSLTRRLQERKIDVLDYHSSK